MCKGAFLLRFARASGCSGRALAHGQFGPCRSPAGKCQLRRVRSTTAFGRRPPVGDVLAGGEAGLAVIETLYCISCKRILDGAQECAAFKVKDFIRMHASTIRKVEFLHHAIHLAGAGKLRTAGKGGVWLD